MESSVVEKDAGAWRRRMLVLVPLVAFLALAALFVLRLGAGDPSRIPSALIGHPAPRTDLPPLPGLERDGNAVPETFVIGRDGRIAYKLIGPVTPDNLEAALKPAIEKALAHP